MMTQEAIRVPVFEWHWNVSVTQQLKATPSQSDSGSINFRMYGCPELKYSAINRTIAAGRKSAQKQFLIGLNRSDRLPRPSARAAKVMRDKTAEDRRPN
jgi:hypothetical protein